MTYPEFIGQWRSGADQIECHTSGSTGKPKSILLPRRQVVASARRTIGFFGLRPDSHLHSCISPDFIGGKMMAVRQMEAGCTLSWETPSNRPLEGYNGPGIDLLAVVPSQMIHILDTLDRGVVAAIRNVIIGGAPIPPGLRRRIAASGLQAWETYGMTETASHIALRRVEDPESPFQTLDGISVSLTSDSRLHIAIEGWQELTTNDVAVITAPGRFEILGRADNVIITGGKKVHPESVEALIESALGIETLVTSEPDDKWGRRVVLVIDNTQHKAIQSDDDAIISELKNMLPPECVPKSIRHEPILKTANGKKKRNPRC